MKYRSGTISALQKAAGALIDPVAELLLANTSDFKPADLLPCQFSDGPPAAVHVTYQPIGTFLVALPDQKVRDPAML